MTVDSDFQATDGNFRREIASHPSDDKLRLAYADFLEESDDPAHQDKARFIRIQVHVAEGTDPDHITEGKHVDFSTQQRKKLNKEAEDIFNRNRVEWEHPLRELGAQQVNFSRGLPSGIQISYQNWTANAERIMQSDPIASLKIKGIGAEVALALAASENLHSLNSLNLGCNDIGDDGVRTLAASENLRGLSSLVISNNRIGDDGMRTLAASENLRGLSSLDLSHNYIASEGVRALAASEHLNGLISLGLKGNLFGSEGVRALAASENLRGLSSLDISCNHIGPEGVRALAASENLCGLSSLDLRDEHIGWDGTRALAMSRNLPPELGITMDTFKGTLAGLRKRFLSSYPNTPDSTGRGR